MPTKERAAELLRDDHADTDEALDCVPTPDPVAALACAYAERVDTSQRLASFGVFAAGLSHHVLNPLSAIAANADLMPSFMQLVADRTDDPEILGALTELDEMATDIRVAAARILETVYGFGGVTTAGRGRKEVAVSPLRPLVEAAVRGLDPALVGDTEVYLEIPEDTPIEADTMSVSHVFTQLLTNALEAGAANIWVVYEPGTPTLLTFADDGAGVSEEDEPHIFEPFFSGWGRPNHFGMGLPSSQLLIESGGGKLIHERRHGGGATFRIVFA